MDFMFTEQDIFTQANQDEKLLLVRCSEILGEASCQELRRLVTGIMTETQQLQFEYLNAMKNRGWISRDVVDYGKIQQLVERVLQIKEKI